MTIIAKLANLITHIFNYCFRAFKDSVIKLKQELYFQTSVNSSAEKLVIFFKEGLWKKATSEKISGGIISIESIYQITREFKNIHRVETVVCTLVGNRLFKFKTFQSSTRIFHFD